MKTENCVLSAFGPTDRFVGFDRLANWSTIILKPDRAIGRFSVFFYLTGRFDPVLKTLVLAHDCMRWHTYSSTNAPATRLHVVPNSCSSMLTRANYQPASLTWVGYPDRERHSPMPKWSDWSRWFWHIKRSWLSVRAQSLQTTQLFEPNALIILFLRWLKLIPRITKEILTIPSISQGRRLVVSCYFGLWPFGLKSIYPLDWPPYELLEVPNLP